MANLSPWLDQKFYLADGVTPNAGGRVFTYEPGTTTKKTTYVSESGAANTNPIILNSAGECNLWLGAGGYKIVNAPANDTDPPAAAIKTWDDINVDNAGGGGQGIVGTIAELRGLDEGAFSIVEVIGYNGYGTPGGGQFYWDATSTASDNGGTIIAPTVSSGTGRWVRILQNQNEVNVSHFGAGSVSAAIDTDALVAAYGSFGSNEGTIVIDVAVDLAAPLNIPSNITIKDGGGQFNPDDYDIDFAGPFDWDIRQAFNYTGTGVATFSATAFGYPEWWGASLASTNNFTPITRAYAALRSVHFVQYGTYLTREVSIPSDRVTLIFPGTVVGQSTGYSSVENVFLCDGTSNIEINGMGGGIVRGIRTNDSEGRMAIRLDEAERVYVHDIILEDMDGDGMHIGASQSAVDLYCKDIHIERVKVDNCRRQGISLLTWDGLVTIRGCYFKDIGAVSGTAPSAGLDVEPDSDFQRMGNLIVEDCLSEGCNGAGFLVHMPAVDGDDDPDKKCDMRFVRCRSVDCNEQGMRITSVINPFTRIEVHDFEAVSCGLSGIIVGNQAVQSSVRFFGKTRLINNFTRTIDNTCPFPYWNSTGSSSNNNKSDILWYSNTVAAWEARNGGSGLMCGNTWFEDLEITHDDAQNIPWLIADNYNQADGAAGGTVRFPIRNVVFDKVWIRTTSNQLHTVDAAYAQDINIKDIKVWDTTNYRWNEATVTRTTSATLSDNADQDIAQVNTGATALVSLTLPTAQGEVGRKQRFKAQVTDANGVSIVCASGDLILLPGHPVPVAMVTSYDIGARIELEKYDATYWTVSRVWGSWGASDLVDVADANYTIVRADHGKTLSDNLATAARTFALPTISATPSADNEVPVGFRIQVINRNSTYRAIIDPASGQSIIGFETSAGGRLQSGADGSSITLIASTSGGAWQVESMTGAWYDLDGTINTAQRHIGNHYFTGQLILTTQTPASAADTGTAGQYAWDTSYFYVCTASNTWRRVAHATW